MKDVVIGLWPLWVIILVLVVVWIWDAIDEHRAKHSMTKEKLKEFREEWEKVNKGIYVGINVRDEGILPDEGLSPKEKQAFKKL
jgi:hypothetical protein